MLIEQWRIHYNTLRPHSSLGYNPPAPETILPRLAGADYAAIRLPIVVADYRSALS